MPIDVGQKAEPHKILCVLYCLYLFSDHYDDFDAQIVFDI